MSPNIIRKIDRDTLYNVWGVPFDPDEEAGVKVIEIIDGDHGRWESYHSVIFVAPDDKTTYEANYSQGLTENQDQRPWEDDDEVTLTQVESRQRVSTVTDWIPVKYGTGAIVEPPTETPKVPTLSQLKARWASNLEREALECPEW